MKVIEVKNVNAFTAKLISKVFMGKSLARVLMNEFAGQIELSGKILDLGSKTNGPSYNRYFKWVGNHEVTYTDLDASGPGLVKLDVEKGFPMSDESYDAVICYNVLEHIFSAKDVLQETRRILKKDGRMVGVVPFFVRYHPDPKDYYRYTHEALERLAQEAGFVSTQIVSLGFGPFTSATSLIGVYLPGFFRGILHLFAYLFDRLFFRKRAIVEPLGYGFIFVK